MDPMGRTPRASPRSPRDAGACTAHGGPQTTVDNLRLAMAAEHVYESVDALAYALQPRRSCPRSRLGATATRPASPFPAGHGPLLALGRSR